MPDARRLRLTLAYDGGGFRGWAAQPGLRTVEGAVREALEKTFASAQGLAVAGRTDTGVHAIANVAGVDVEGGPPAAHAAQALNTVLQKEALKARFRELGMVPRSGPPSLLIDQVRHDTDLYRRVIHEAKLKFE